MRLFENKIADLGDFKQNDDISDQYEDYSEKKRESLELLNDKKLNLKEDDKNDIYDLTMVFKNKNAFINYVKEGKFMKSALIFR